MKMNLKLTFIFSLICFSHAWAMEYVGVKPIFIYGDIDILKQIINLTPTPDQKTLTLDDDRNGYIVKTRRQIYGSGGINGNFSQAVSEGTYAWGSLGIYPVLHTYATFINSAENLQAAESLKQSIPTEANDIFEWRTGDNSTYQVMGGISFAAMVGMGTTSAGEKIIIEGGWEYYVEKKNDFEVYVEIKRISSRTLTTIGALSVASAEITLMKDFANGFGYIIKLDSMEGRNAYEDILHGHIDRAEERSQVVQKISSVEYKKSSNLKKIAIASPFIPAINLLAGKEIQEYQETRKDNLNKATKTNYILSIKRRAVRILGYEKLTETSFLVLNTNQQSPTQTQNLTESQLYWDTNTSYSSSDRLLHMREKLKKLTGLNDFLNFSVKDDEELKFAQIHFSLNFNTEMNKRLIENLTLLKPVLQDELRRNAIDVNELNYMIRTIDREASKHSLKSIAKIGQHFWDTPRLFQLALNLAKKCGGEMALEVSGKRISFLTKKENYLQSQLCPIGK